MHPGILYTDSHRKSIALKHARLTEQLTEFRSLFYKNNLQLFVSLQTLFWGWVLLN